MEKKRFEKISKDIVKAITMTGEVKEEIMQCLEEYVTPESGYKFDVHFPIYWLGELKRVKEICKETYYYVVCCDDTWIGFSGLGVEEQYRVLGKILKQEKVID